MPGQFPQPDTNVAQWDGDLLWQRDRLAVWRRRGRGTRADLWGGGRTDRANPAWNLTEAGKIGFSAVAGPKQYLPAKLQLERNRERERQLAAAGAGLTPQQVAAKLLEG